VEQAQRKPPVAFGVAVPVSAPRGAAASVPGKQQLTMEIKSMFDSLEEQIKRDDRMQISRKERVLKNVAIAALSVLLFGGLYFAVRLVE